MFHGFLFLLHRNYLVYLIKLLDAFSFIFLLLYKNFFFILHRLSNCLALIFILLYRDFLFLLHNFPIPQTLSFFFCRIETLGRDCSSIASLGDDALVKGFLTLMLSIEGDEEKCSFFPLFAVGLVEEGASSNSCGGGGEISLYGE
jgi:hypothetical protein